MHRAVFAAWLFGWAAVPPLCAQETVASPGAALPAMPAAPEDAAAGPVPAPAPASPCDAVGQAEESPWQAPWGLADLRAIPEGPKTAPNGVEYHPNFCMDLDFNWWIWRSQRLYLFGDASFWGETGEDGVTNSKDGFLGTSKRQIDLSGGAAWNYVGSWEVRAFGYSMNNLNRGDNLVRPTGYDDGAGFENRYYLSPEYANLGRPGFDVARATFLSFGYYPSKTMTGNDGQPFKPGLLLRAYLIHDLWDWPCYAFGDVQYISESSLQPKLLLFDVGLAARPLRCCPQCEFRLGAENTADLQVRDVQSLLYVSARFIF